MAICFVTIGDRSQSPPWDMAQKLDNDLGKMIRITPDGAPAPGNPFINKHGALPEIWSYGHRSEEGLTINSKIGALWGIEHGPRGGGGGLNTPEAGKNYGWPVIVHGIDYPGETIGQGITEKAGMEQPLYYWDPVIAPSGRAFYTGNLFPQWKNSVFVGALRGQMLDRLVLSGKGYCRGASAGRPARSDSGCTRRSRRRGLRADRPGHIAEAHSEIKRMLSPRRTR
jgi:glucose/arabinose dehydrogenase